MKRYWIAGMMAVAMLLAACANDTEPSGTPTTPFTSPPATETSPVPSPTEQASGTVNVATTALGEILVDEEGRTLYLFLQDSAGMSACRGGCASTWPALTITGTPTAGAGANEALLATIQRSDGGTQVTYNDHPLYRYANDAAAGDTNGQGVGGNWYVVSPAGEAIQS